MLYGSANGFVAVFAVSIDAQWIVLQSLAWAGMVVSYSQKAPLAVALSHTFDGKHPCCLCKAIVAGKQSGKSHEFTLQLKKLEFPPAPENFVPLAPMQFQLLPMANNASAEFLAQKPPTPPPRSFFA